MQAPEFSADWYRGITEWAHGTPSWLHSVAEVGTDAGLLLFAMLFVAGWWRARGGDARAMGLALAAPCAMVAGYLVSEVSKSFLQEERPCRAVAGAMNIAACPAPGDWSFPSNHATIAAGSAAAIVVAWRAMAPLVLPLAALMAFSRVFVGVHYPHDVAAGFLVGVTVATLVALALARVAAPVVRVVREVPFGAVLLGPSPAPAGAMAGTGMIPPGSAHPGGVHPGADQQGVGQPGVGQQGAGQPGMGQPGAGRHGGGRRPAGAPGPGAPGAGQAAQTMPDVMGGTGRHRRPHE